MGISWTDIRLDFKSPLRVVVRFLWRSRETKTQKCRELKQQLDEAQQTISRQEAEMREQEEKILALKEQTRRLEEQNRQARQNAGCRTIRR